MGPLCRLMGRHNLCVSEATEQFLPISAQQTHHKKHRAVSRCYSAILPMVEKHEALEQENLCTSSDNATAYSWSCKPTAWLFSNQSYFSSECEISKGKETRTPSASSIEISQRGGHSMFYRLVIFYGTFCIVWQTCSSVISLMYCRLRAANSFG